MTNHPLIEMLVQSLAESELVLALFDPRDNLQWANRRYHEMFLRGLALPVPFADVLRHGFHGGFGVRIDSGDIEEFLADILPRRRRAGFRKFATDTVDGRWLWMTETLQPNGWLLSSGSDITDLKLRERGLREAHEAAAASAQRDESTGALNRQQILAAVENAVQRADAGGAPLCVAVIELPEFQRIFLGDGHPAAEQALAGLARSCLSQLRPGDCCGRSGSGELLLLLPGVRESLALRMLERIDAHLQRSGEGPLAVCAGVAELAPAETFASLMRRLYRQLEVARVQLERGAQRAAQGEAGAPSGKAAGST